MESEQPVQQSSEHSETPTPVADPQPSIDHSQLIPDHISTQDVLLGAVHRLRGTEFTVALTYLEAALEHLPK